jgi:hypothetical protein
MNDAITVTATFNQTAPLQRFTLTVSKAGLARHCLQPGRDQLRAELHGDL